MLPNTSINNDSIYYNIPSPNTNIFVTWNTKIHEANITSTLVPDCAMATASLQLDLFHFQVRTDPDPIVPWGMGQFALKQVKLTATHLSEQLQALYHHKYHLRIVLY